MVRINAERSLRHRGRIKQLVKTFGTFGSFFGRFSENSTPEHTHARIADLAVGSHKHPINIGFHGVAEG